jgi:hypothetical protein
LQIDRWVYSVSAPPSLEIKVLPRTGFAVSTGYVFTIGSHDEAQPFYLGINVLAVVLTWTLLHLSVRRRNAARRLESQRDEPVQAH